MIFMDFIVFSDRFFVNLDYILPLEKDGLLLTKDF